VELAERLLRTGAGDLRAGAAASGNGADDLLERLAGMGERLGLAASATAPPKASLPEEQPSPAAAQDVVARRRRPHRMIRGAC